MSFKAFCELTVRGTGFFSPRFASLDHLFSAQARDPVAPPFALISGRARRFTSLVTQMHLEVAGQALQALLGQRGGTIDPREVGTIFASVGGELSTAETLIESIRRDASASAARFVQSVHNTPSGIFSIATGNVKPSNTITAGDDTLAAALCEAALLCAEETRPVLVSLADESVPAVFAPERVYAAFAGALVVERAASTGSMGPRLRLEFGALEPTPPGRSSELPDEFRSSPIAPMISLLRAIHAGCAAEVAVGAFARSAGGARALRCQVAL